MKLTYNWLKEFVDLDLAPEALSAKFISLGIEVESLTRLGDFSGVVVGLIEKIEAHPNADKLVYCTVDAGKEKKLNIVCGAKNMKAGDKVPVAVDGAELPGGFKIKHTKLRGLLSEGMLCSSKELGISEEADGLLILPSDAPIGRDITEYLNLKDWLFSLEILPNRPDYLGIIGVARMLSASLKIPLKTPEIEIKKTDGKAASEVKVTIADKELCPRYTARIIKGVKPGASPLLMQLRLKFAGVRPINNIVDITNYVLLELGHPLHAFDKKLISGNHIIVRRAEKGEKMTTLDGVTRELGADMLVIADEQKAVALAGIMGGNNSEINSSTTEVLLESAFFDAVNIRKTSKTINLSTEASFRFERGMDHEGMIRALDRAAYLLQKYCGGEVCEGIIDIYPEKIKARKITTRFDRVRKLLGTDIPDGEMLGISERLGFKMLAKDKTGFTVEVPSFRVELDREIDMIEEIAQVYGYEQIKERTPLISLTSCIPQTSFEDEVKRALVGRGLYEAVNWSFMAKSWFDKGGFPAGSPLREYPEILNPLTDEWNVMRTTLLPGLLANTTHNVTRFGNRNLRLFEVGKVFLKDSAGKFSEHKNIGIIATGLISDPGWAESPVEADLYYIKGLVESVLASLRVPYELLEGYEGEAYEKGSAVGVSINGKTAGCFGELRRNLLKAFDIKQRVFYSKLEIPSMEAARTGTIKFTHLPKFPAIKRDISFIVRKNITSAAISAYIESLRIKLIEKMTVTAVYEGDNVGKELKSVTFAIVFRSPDRTLTDKEVDDLNNSIIAGAAEKLGAVIRK